MTTLQLLISTIDNGIDRVAGLVLPPAEGIGYVVSWQHSAGKPATELPPELKRPDITVTHLDGRGLSRNRNNALSHASADICLIADDDCRYSLERLRAVVDTFDCYPDVDLAAFRMESRDEQRSYPDRSFALDNPPRGYMAYSVEIAFRRTAIAGRVQFNPHFGLGAERFHCGEEEIFVHDALEAGLVARFFPVTVVTHDGATTDHARAGQREVLQGKGAYLYIGYRPKMFLYPFPIARRLKRLYGVPFFYALRHMFAGLAYIITHPHIARAGQLKQ